LSLNSSKTKYILFHSNHKKKALPSILPIIRTDKTTIERTKSSKFLGVLIDENLSWDPHINTINTKISKNIGLLYKSRPFLSFNNLKLLYFSFINSYLSYANIAWASTHKTKLSSLYKRQKLASRIIFYKDKRTHANPLLKQMNALNVYQINIYQNILFMLKHKLGIVPSRFINNFF